MRPVVIVASVLVSVLLPAAELAAQATSGSEHFDIEWRETYDADTRASLEAASDRMWSAVTSFIGESPDQKVRLVFGGPSEQPDGRRDYPRVDGNGTIYLFRFTDDPANHLNALDHELVHALRIDRRQRADWFFEEGFAEFVALRSNASREGFPWFGYPVELVAGQWVASGEDLDLVALRDRHRELNGACRAQAYALRSSFFTWLGDTYGDEIVLTAAAERPAGGNGSWVRHFGAPLATLAERWRTDLSAAFKALPDARASAAAYREQSPIRYQRVCPAS